MTNPFNQSILTSIKERGRASPEKPPHELADSVNQIIALVGVTPKYPYGYWLRLVKKSKMTVFDIEKLVKEAAGKEKKGGFLTNKLLRK